MYRRFVPSALVTLVALVIGVLWSAPAVADPTYPAPVGRCVDTSGVLGSQLCDRITTILRQDENTYSDEIAVVVVPTTGGTSIESWATGVFNSWGVGKQGQNNGVLLAVAVNDRKMRIATGSGLATRLPEAAASEINEQTIKPKFQSGAYAAGILAGLDAIRVRLNHAVTDANQLTALASVAPAPSGAATATGSPSPSGTVTSTYSAYSASHKLSGGTMFPILLSALCGFFCLVAVVILIATVVKAAARGASHPGRSRSQAGAYYAGAYDASSSSSYDSGSSSSFDSGSSSSSYDSGSSSSFGGGSSDGGGSSSSW